MKQPEGSPAYWQGMVQWSIAEIQKGSEDPQELYALIYMASLKLRDWETFLGQKAKRRQRNKSARMARKRNRRK